MRLIQLFVLAGLVFVIGLGQRQSLAAKPIIAVFDLELKRVRLKKDLVEALWETLTTKLAESGAYQVVPREKLKSRLKREKRKSYKRCFAKSCQLAIGRELAANKTLSARITRVGRLCLVSLKVWDLRKATAERAAQAEGRCKEGGLLRSIKVAVAKLTGTAVSSVAPTGATARPSKGTSSCGPGRVAISGHCCWPGQDWGAGSKRCIGAARCPAGFVKAGAGCRAGCAAEGKLLVGGHCCWPGQDWGARAKRCLGKPSRCPTGMLVEANGCGGNAKLGKGWARITGGSFVMGSKIGEADERPLRKVRVAAFSLQRSEVTVAQYGACVKAGKCKKPGTNSGCNWGRKGRASHPINCVRWSDASAFCRWVGARLPSEAEFEYAARDGGKKRVFPWGDARATCKHAVMKHGGTGCGKGRTWPVCAKKLGSTTAGVCDLAGNVWEWVADCYKAGYTGAPATGAARSRCGSTLRVFRGGGWYGEAKHLRAADRSWLAPTARTEFLGFRCAK
jgi:formylglycine-generating enzyme required for sulfatase activity